jgi:hypothetical protein
MSCALAACSTGVASNVSTAVTTAEANASGVATNVTTFTQADLQAAIKMANAATPPDTEAAACFTYLSGQLTALQTQIANGTAPVGAASAFEAGNIALNNTAGVMSSQAKVALETACAPLAQHVRAQAITVGAESAAILAVLGIKIAVPATAAIP